MSGSEAGRPILLRGLLLSPGAYADAVARPSTGPLCGLAVVASGLAVGVQLTRELEGIPIVVVLTGLVLCAARAAFDAALVWGILRLGFGGASRFTAVLRPVALATLPGVAYPLASLLGPPLGTLAGTLIGFWALGAFVQAIRALSGGGLGTAIGVAVLTRVLDLGLYAVAGSL